MAGKFGDMIAVELDSLEMAPMYNILSHIVYTAGRERCFASLILLLSQLRCPCGYFLNEMEKRSAQPVDRRAM